MIDLVLDASAGVELLLNGRIGRSLTAKLPTPAHWWVPEHYFVEVGAALRRLERIGTLSPARAAVAFHELSAVRLERAQTLPLLGKAWARRANLTFADAMYVVLAESIGATLVTADLKLAASPNLPVPTITP